MRCKEAELHKEAGEAAWKKEAVSFLNERKRFGLILFLQKKTRKSAELLNASSQIKMREQEREPGEAGSKNSQ